MIATAGHVDHGKSTLVRALTGMEPDRWAEERERGLTIDLGYAWTTLPTGAQVAFVDVPGHRRFVTNMLAGVGPAPAVVLVVAADEGWRAQTAEHLAALDALQVRHGVLAITRADLGDAGRAEAEARRRLAGTTLAGIEAVAVSPVTGHGLDELRAALGRLTAALPPPPDRPARLWIDRSFSVRGAGTVVTGTLTSGVVQVDDELELVPSGARVRVRSIELLKTPVAQAAAVARVAINLRHVKPADLPRGAALVAPGAWPAVTTCDVRLTHPADRLPAEVTCHVGSLATPARLRPLGSDTARLTLPTAAPLRIGDRALLRPPGDMGLLVGATVLDPYPAPLRRRGAARQRAAQLTRLTGEPDGAALLELSGSVRRDQLLRSGAAVPETALEHAGWLVAPAQWTQWRDRLVATVDEQARATPVRPGLPPAAAAQRVGLPDPVLVAALAADLPGIVVDHDGVHRAGLVATLPPAAHRALDELVAQLQTRPFAAPEAPQLAASGLTDAHLATAVKDGRLLRLPGPIYLLPSAPAEAARRLAALPQPFTLSVARQALETTRRVALPLLAELDRRRLTRRVDEQRRAIV